MAAKRSGDSRKGILVDTWKWKTKTLDSEISAHLRGEDDEPKGPDAEMTRSEDRRPQLVEDKVLNVEVRLMKKFSAYGDNEGQLNAVEFQVRCDEIGLVLVGSDIEVLRTAAWAKLEERFKIAWERYYLVQIASAQSFKGDYEVGFALSQNTIFRGVAHDGTVLMREYDRGRTSSPWRYRPWPQAYEERPGHAIACIKDTLRFCR